MGKLSFIIEHKNEKHECYLGDDHRIYVLDKDGKPRSVSAPSDFANLDYAKDAARHMVERLQKH